MTDLLGLDDLLDLDGDVDAQFWAIVCADEELLDLEVAGILRTTSAPPPSPRAPAGREPARPPVKDVRRRPADGADRAEPAQPGGARGPPGQAPAALAVVRRNALRRMVTTTEDC